MSKLIQQQFDFDALLIPQVPSGALMGEVIKNSRNDYTLVCIVPVNYRGVPHFVVKVERDYKNGKVYQEPDHYWPSLGLAKNDYKDWITYGKKTDW